MSRIARLTLGVSVMLAVFMLPASLDAQRRAVPRPPAKPTTPSHAITVRGHVFVGGYFYDPMFGPYPWWPRTAYPYWYFPIYDRAADIKLKVTPNTAAVYVDGFYAGIAGDFDGVFESLRLTPGGHNVVLYLERYRTTHHNIYLQPGSTFKLRDTLERLPPGSVSEPPPVAPAVPPPPEGTYRTPRWPAPVPSGSPAPPVPPSQAAGFGVLDLRVQPAAALVLVDGKPWESSDEGHLAVQLPAGMHRIEISSAGHRRFTTTIEVREGETTPLNVSLTATAL